MSLDITMSKQVINFRPGGKSRKEHMKIPPSALIAKFAFLWMDVARADLAIIIFHIIVLY